MIWVQRLVARLTVGLTETLTVELEVPELGLRVPARIAGGYYRPTREARPGGGEQVRHEVILERNVGESLERVDADVLGPLLANVLADQPPEDLGPQLARVISRYQRVHGGRRKMEKFFVGTLSIPGHLLEEAEDLLRGEDGRAVPGEMAPIELAPAKIPEGTTGGAGGPCGGERRPETDGAPEKGDIQDGFAEAIAKKSKEAFESLVKSGGHDRSVEDRTAGGRPGGAGADARRAAPRPTTGQLEMGRQGEELVLGKLQEGEWPGWALIADRRFENCGYDLEVETPEGRHRLEIKTAWHLGGEISLTWNEFETAKQERSRYRLMIVEAHEGPVDTWRTSYCDDPVSRFTPEDVRVEGAARIVAPVARFQRALAV